MEWSEFGFTIGGAIAGYWLAVRLYKRRERNKVRLPIWRAFSEKYDQKGIFSRPDDTTIDDVAGYKATVSRREWKAYSRHAAEIRRIRALEEWGKLDPKTGTYPILRPLTRQETAQLEQNMGKIVRLTRQR